MTGVQTCALPICFPVTIGGAGMGMQLGLMEAQKRNLEADAAKKEADAKKKAGADT